MSIDNYTANGQSGFYHGTARDPLTVKQGGKDDSEE